MNDRYSLEKDMVLTLFRSTMIEGEEDDSMVIELYQLLHLLFVVLILQYKTQETPAI
jgi:hypothetical protein